MTLLSAGGNDLAGRPAFRQSLWVRIQTCIRTRQGSEHPQRARTPSCEQTAPQGGKCCRKAPHPRCTCEYRHGELTDGSEDAASLAKGDGNGGLSHTAGARVDQYALPRTQAPPHHQGVVGRGVDHRHRGCLFKSPAAQRKPPLLTIHTHFQNNQKN